MRAQQLRRLRSACRWPITLLLAGASIARAQDFILPPTVLLPNYDRVHPGLAEALEGGAYIARAQHPPSVFYNPAGIATIERSVLSATGQGYELTTVSGTGFEHSSPVSSVEAMPSFLGVVLGREVIDWKSVSLGFALVRSVHWDQSVIATSVPAEGQRVSYSVHSTFDTWVPTASAGWALSSTLRLGASLEFPYTTISDQGQLSGEVTDSVSSQATVRSLATSGWTLQLVGVVGAQWLPVPWLHLGVVARSPGLKMLSGGSFQYEALSNAASGTRHVFFQDAAAQFEYRQPMQVSTATAVEFGPVQLEVDLRWHNGTHTYNLLSSTEQGRIVDTSSGGPVTSGFVFPGVAYRARPIWNWSVGGRFHVGSEVTLSLGTYMDNSPADPATKVFRRVDLLGFRVGVAFQVEKLGMSLGAGWERGTASDNLALEGALLPAQSGQLTLNTFSLLFSVDYKF